MEIRNRTPYAFAPLMGRVNYPAHTATLVVKVSLRMVQGGACELLDEQPGLQGDVLSKADVPECLYDADLAQFKPRADLLLTGRCHTPGGTPTATCPVVFRVGNWSKTLAAIGNRTWHKGLVFSRMSEIEPFTTVPVTWGNAYGGPTFKPNPAGTGHKGGMLPNIEHPDRLIKSPSDKPEPAGFGPIHRTWRFRAKKLGTYDQKWLKQRFPAFAEDLDWTYFNAAPADQQLPGFLRGDEELELTNLNARHALFKSHLPGRRVRVLLREGDDAAVREVPMNLDTLHVEAEKGEVHLVWRGIADVSDEDWAECRDILIVDEPLEKPRSMEELLPLFDEIEDAEEPEEPEEEVDTPEKRAQRIKAMEADFAEAEKIAQGHLARVQKSAEQTFKGDVNLAEAMAKPPKPTDMKAVLKGFQDLLTPAGLALPGGLGTASPSAMIEAEMKEMLALVGPETQAKPADKPGILAVLRSGEAPGGDFSGTDLAGEDLSGLDLNGCYFNDANLGGANLGGANLSGASLIRANLAGANLSEANLADADFSGADLGGAMLDKANLTEALFLDAKAEGASFAGVSGAEAVFVGMQGANAKFAGATLDESIFTNAQLPDADFSEASLKDVAFDGVAAARANFSGAKLAGFRGSDKSDFTAAIFKGADAPGSVWEGSLLKGADFRGCNLKDAQFPNADLSGAKLYGADLSGALMRKVILAGAEAGNANFFQAMLEKADLGGASMVGSNFYEAEFLDAKTEGADFSGANLKMTKLAQ